MERRKNDRRTAPRAKSTSKKPLLHAAKRTGKASDSPPPETREGLEALMLVDPLSMELGRGLLPLVDPVKGAKLLERERSLRRHLALELGLVVPPVRVKDNLQLKPGAYLIKVRDIEVAQGEVVMAHFLAIGPEDKLKNLSGDRTADPTFGMPGAWIPEEQRGDAERLGCMIFDPVSVIATQLAEVVRTYAADLLGLQEVKSLLDFVGKTHPAVVAEVHPVPLGLCDLQRVLQNLLRERVSIRDLVLILEELARRARDTKDLDRLTEHVRVRLARVICREYLSYEGVLNAVTLAPELEECILQAVHRSESGCELRLAPPMGQEILRALERELGKLTVRGMQPVVLCAPPVRPAVRRLTERSFPTLAVLSWEEISTHVIMNSVGTVALPSL